MQWADLLGAAGVFVIVADCVPERLEHPRLPDAFAYAAECLACYGEPAKFLPGERVECACGGYGRVREVLRRPGQVPERVRRRARLGEPVCRRRSAAGRTEAIMSRVKGLGAEQKRVLLAAMQAHPRAVDVAGGWQQQARTLAKRGLLVDTHHIPGRPDFYMGWAKLTPEGLQAAERLRSGK